MITDFGLARAVDPGRAHTNTNTPLIGTVAYMAPEQVRGGWLGPATDIYGLGVVLFELLTGELPFQATSPMLTAAMHLECDPPRPSSRAPAVPGAWDALVLACLEKEPRARPDESELLACLGGVQPLHWPTPRRRPGRQVGGPVRGQRDGQGESAESGAETASTYATTVKAQKQGAPAPTITSFPGRERRVATVLCGRLWDDRKLTVDTVAAMEAELRRSEVSRVEIGGGSLLAVLTGPGAVGDRSIRAAHLALTLRDLTAGMHFAIVTGDVDDAAGGVLVSDALDQAAVILDRMTGDKARVLVAEDTAPFLEQNFVLARSTDGLVLTAVRHELAPARLLLGHPTPLVGRNKELTLLQATLTQCEEDSVARVVLITGEPGAGKSRLRAELVTGHTEHIRVLTAYADPTGTVTMVRQLIRRAVNLQNGLAEAEQHRALRAYLLQLAPASPQLPEFLGELAGARTRDPPSPELQAARNDPQILNRFLTRAFVEWLGAECARQPTLLVLEDLHWGDMASVRYLGEALRKHPASPLMVLALGRPELDSVFPNLWSGAEPQLLRLGRLTPKAVTQLVRAVLGPEMDETLPEQVVAMADGNPFHVEELVRCIVRGEEVTWPKSVLALVRSRLEQLPADARQLICTASVFGETCWAGAVAYALCFETPTLPLATLLDCLLAGEILEPVADSRFVSDREYKFRHGLLREAAYAMLSAEDRARAHVRAGQWLTENGERTPRVLAHHFELGGDREQALPWLVSAAQQALDCGDANAALECIARGMRWDPEADLAGRFRELEAEAHAILANWPEAAEAGRAAASLLPSGEAPWFRAQAVVLMASAQNRDASSAMEAGLRVLNTPLPSELTGPTGHALFWVRQALLNSNQVEAADQLLDRAQELLDSGREADLAFRAWVKLLHGFREVLDDRLGKGLLALRDARALAGQSQSGGAQIHSTLGLVMLTSQTGHVLKTAQAASAVLSLSESINTGLAPDWARFFCDSVPTLLGPTTSTDDSRAVASLRTLSSSADPLLALQARTHLSLGLAKLGQLDKARSELAHAMAQLRFPFEVGGGLAAKAHVELLAGSAEQALADARRGLEISTLLPWARALLCYVRARALLALEQFEEARAVLQDAQQRILQVADGLDDAELRHTYLTDVFANAATLGLAEQWLR